MNSVASASHFSRKPLAGSAGEVGGVAVLTHEALRGHQARAGRRREKADKRDF